MDYSSAWLRFCKAEEEYFASRYDFVQNEMLMVSDLNLGLANASHNDTALRLLLEVRPRVEVILPLLPIIINLAVDSSSYYRIELAQEVLHNYKSESRARSTILTLVSTYLDENDEWHYRRIAELYELMSYEEELTDFLALCRANANLEIQEIQEDFIERKRVTLSGRQ
ncbi:hypothetical protein FNT36_10330 [Hymenobacter setariae]|uniref:HEAT repeat domain-containing protein n=1 Tax=Hymenobacter setariae TaxID=2594794 RepID=A0A558BZ56_9BACT|nr:hypothetical protein [Hymenobacter setariae]TVT41810.1 hypothetical protein FNT36_10330 [Hymenobacter setariae]